MDEVMRKLRNSGPSSSGGSRQQETTQAPIYSAVLPPTTTTTPTSAPNKWDNVFRHLKPVTVQLPEEYECLKTFTFEGVTGTDDFPDDKLRGRKAIRLIPLEDNEVCRLGKELFQRINYSISQYHLGVIFLLAFQLKTAGDGKTERMFPAFDELGIPEDIDYFLVDRSGRSDGGYVTTVHESGEIYENAAAYSFLACSILKYFVRSVDNFSNSLQHIQSGFRKFYARDFPLGAINIRRDTISMIHNHFSNSELLKNTLYRFLYNANHRGMVCDIQSFIYDKDLTHTGIHAVPIAFTICVALQCSAYELLAAIYARRFQPQIKALLTAFQLLVEKERHRRQMWKYARIFDHTFLLPLQTMRYPKFTFILACILKNESPAVYPRILELKQYEEIPQRDRERLETGTRLHMTALKNSLALKERYDLMPKVLDYLYNPSHNFH
ncbi:uncharacterized protein LOC106767500 [Vigna radiata var. radiata]|uniref:Uncharacterized protein LOC106767500 n=1 Tax=Vigna radiata var. radiata TaxID=3916 RepID=A0A1S3UP95_VIGRR|nr:uncharacterized protein LOC106767500 [Vigna radiata var. radiata]